MRNSSNHLINMVDNGFACYLINMAALICMTERTKVCWPRAEQGWAAWLVNHNETHWNISRRKGHNFIGYSSSLLAQHWSCIQCIEISECLSMLPHPSMVWWGSLRRVIVHGDHADVCGFLPPGNSGGPMAPKLGQTMPCPLMSYAHRTCLQPGSSPVPQIVRESCLIMNMLE